MPEVTIEEKRAAETRLRSSAKKQRVTQPAILTTVALQRIVDGVYDTVKEAGDNLDLSARQRKELREHLEATRKLDHFFTAVEQPQQGSSEQQEGEPEGPVQVPAAGPQHDGEQQQDAAAGKYLTDEQVAMYRGYGADAFKGTDDEFRAWHAMATKKGEEFRRQTNPVHPIAKGLRWGGEGMGWFDPKRARREEREHRKQKRLQRILPLVRLEEDVQQQDRMNMCRTHATPPGWIFGCSEVEQGDTGAGVLLPSSRARDLCACSVLTPWAWCWACDGGEPTPMSKTLSGGELVRCQDCRTVRCTANCGCVFYNTPEVPDDRFMLFSHCE